MKNIINFLDKKHFLDFLGTSHEKSIIIEIIGPRKILKMYGPD